MPLLSRTAASLLLAGTALGAHAGARAATAAAAAPLDGIAARPVLAGAIAFVLVALALALLLVWAMRRAGASVKPLLWLAGFLLVVGGPQAALHIGTEMRAAPAGALQVAAQRAPVAWATVFGPRADPDLMVDGRRAAPGVLDAALDSRLSFGADGRTALAARFDSVQAAQQALDRYGSFFQFDQVTGSDAQGWTARRYGGSAGWTHVLTAGSELYAWTAPERATVVAERERVYGPLRGDRTAAIAAGDIARIEPGQRLFYASFALLALVAAVLWFFKGAAWAARRAPVPGTAAVPADQLACILQALNRGHGPQQLRHDPASGTWTVDWPYGDARWFDHAQLQRLRRATRLVLRPDAASRSVIVREYWSAFDAALGAGRLHGQWQRATGIQFFAVERQRVYGVQVDASGQATGALSHCSALDLQQLKAPLIEAVTSAGWTWQPVVWELPRGLGWLQ